MAAKPLRSPRPISIKLFIRLVIIAVFLYLVLAGFSGIRTSLAIIRTASSRNIGLAIVAVALSYVCAAVTYLWLSPKRLRFVPTLIVEISSGLINRLLPGGLGGLGINALYLKKQGCNLATASAVVAVNNSLGTLGNIMLLLIVTLLTPLHLPVFHFQLPVIIGISAAICVVTLLLIYTYRSKLRYSLVQFGLYAQLLGRRPLMAASALGSSMALTIFHATGLYFVLMALHIPASWPLALLAISAGAFGGAAVPTPGGLGGAEAGIIGVLIAAGFMPAAASASAIVYRGITYWLPLLPGYLAYRIVEKRYI